MSSIQTRYFLSSKIDVNSWCWFWRRSM